MRLHIELDDALVERVDRMAGSRGRSRFIREAVAWALENASRAELIRSSFGSIDDKSHDWDRDPAAWVREQRRTDRRRIG
jgi:Arc/MetJ family transcription regulator